MSTLKVNSITDTSDNPLLGRRNAIINGGMYVWQRGTSFSSNVYTADRWKAYAGSGHSISRSTDVPSGSKYSLSFTGTGDSAGIRQNIEGKDCTHLAGNDVTVSFYLKQTSGAGTGVLKVALAYATSEDNFGGTTYISQPTIDTSSSWTKYTLTYSNIHADSKNGLQLAIKNAGTGTVTFLLSQVQLELGSVATPFEHRSYVEELARCQRYYWKTYSAFSADTTTSFLVNIQYPTTMRVSPSVSWSYGGVANNLYKLSDATTPGYSSPNGLFAGIDGVSTTYKFGTSFTKGDTYATYWVFDSEIG